jgi:hypothetical protein
MHIFGNLKQLNQIKNGYSALTMVFCLADSDVVAEICTAGEIAATNQIELPDNQKKFIIKIPVADVSNQKIQNPKSQPFLNSKKWSIVPSKSTRAPTIMDSGMA